MHVELPLPTNLVLLTLLLPGVVLAGYELCAWLTRRRLLRQGLTPVLALAVWLLSVHAAALATRSFVAGLRVGTVVVALAGVAARIHRGRVARGGSGVGRGLGPAAVVLVALSTVPVAWMAWKWFFHDEELYTGHMSISAEIQNDIYPPRHLTFSDLPLRYHYGFNLLVACITALTRARVDMGIDIATLLLWVSTGSVVWALGERWFGRGWLLFPVMLLAGGPPVCLFDPPGSRSAAPGRCRLLGPGVLPPLVSNFFQHPWALGLPLALAALLVFSARAHERRRARLVVLGILLTALSLGHVVLFFTVLPSIVAAEVWFAWTTERRSLGAVGVLATAAAVVAAAVVLGAPVGSIGGAGSNALVFRLGVGNGLADTLRWHAQSFGVALPLALVGLPFVPRAGRVVTALLFCGSLLVVDAVRYVHSGDIIKFGVVALVAMALAGAAAANRLLLAGRGLRLAHRAVLGGLVAAVVAASSWGGLAFERFFFTKAVDRYYAHELPPMAPDDERAASFIRRRVKAGEMVFRREGPAADYARWAGLPVPWFDWGTQGFGFPQERLDARSRLLKTLPAAPEAYLAQSIDWFVLDAADATLNARADAWIASGRAAVLATFGRLRVVKLGPLR